MVELLYMTIICVFLHKSDFYWNNITKIIQYSYGDVRRVASINIKQIGSTKEMSFVYITVTCSC